jgi:lipoprotein-anchoring transpeptidase ErfK/SrfK
MTISFQQLCNNSNRWFRPGRTSAAPQLQPGQKPQLQRRRRGWLVLAGVTGLLLAALCLLLRVPTGSTGQTVTPAKNTVSRTPPRPAAAAKVPPAAPPGRELARLRDQNATLRERIRAQAPAGNYLVIDTAGNKVSLRSGETTRAEMIASCGSGNILEDPDSGRRWVFDTPRGQFRIQSKLTNPIWMKPDWAFIEEGAAIPKNSAARAERGMMGDYALGIGQGYFIHGTLYTRMLGRNVSHGCVRLGAKDLEHLYRTLPIGTRVIIF